MSTSDRPAHQSGSFAIGGDLVVHRLGFGAMQITGAGIWGPPDDVDNALAVLRTAADLGVDFIDTADSYGPAVSEELIAAALWPYDGDRGRHEGRTDAHRSRPVARGGLPGVPHAAVRAVAAPAAASRRSICSSCTASTPACRWLIRSGRSSSCSSRARSVTSACREVTVGQLRAASRCATITTVQNLYHLANRRAEPVLDVCPAEGIGFIPWFPIATGELARPGGVLATSPPRPAHRRPSWRWPGCCSALRSCCRSPARSRWPTSARTSRRRPCDCPTSSRRCRPCAGRVDPERTGVSRRPDRRRRVGG